MKIYTIITYMIEKVLDTTGKYMIYYSKFRYIYTCDERDMLIASSSLESRCLVQTGGDAGSGSLPSRDAEA